MGSYFFQNVILLLLLFKGIHSWGITDWATDAWEDTTETATSTWNSLSNAVSEAADDTTQFFTSISESPIFTDVISSIQQVVTLTLDTIEDVVDDFNVTTWKRLTKDAKYVIYNLPQEIQYYIAVGCNFLSNLVDMDFIPFPLNVVQENDFYTVTDCVADSVFDLAVEWTKEVATTFINIVGKDGVTSTDFTPLLNTELISNELNDTYMCLFNLANDISQREQENNDINIWEEATDFFQFDNLTITIQISFTACTLTCGTASLGFAQSASDFNIHKPFYSVSMGIDSSSVVGASIGASIGFKKNFSSIIGSDHSVSFGVGIELPLLPDISLPNIGIDLGAGTDNEGEFLGFTLESDIIDFNMGLNGAFNMGYQFTETKWVYTTEDLRDAWNAVEDIVDEKIDNINTLTNDILDIGGYLVKAGVDEISSLMCPSGISDTNSENINIGNLSVLQLGSIDIYDVVFGNINGNNNCNSTKGYDAIRNMCQYGSHCSFTVNTETLGNVYCDVNDIDLTVIYGCPNQLDVFNLGCYDINFLDVINNNWFEDYNNEILNDGWENRNNGMAKCAKIAKDNGYIGFGTYNNGMCIMAKNFFNDGVYNKMGVSNGSICPLNGLGNDISMNLYAFANGNIAYDDLGCINKTQIDLYNSEYNKDLYKSFKTFENIHYLFKDNYKNRPNAISKCAQLANEKNYKGFALFDGGMCYLSNQFKNDIINKINELSNVDNNTQLSCAKGTNYAYNVFQFPYVDINNEEDNKGLTGGQIALIVIIPIILIILVVIGFLLFRKYKKNNSKVHKKSKNSYKPPSHERL